MLKYYLYNHIPGTHHSWTLAILATSQTDADRYAKTYNGGGRRAGTVDSGKVKADCGAVTAAAEEILRQKAEVGRI